MLWQESFLLNKMCRRYLFLLGVAIIGISPYQPASALSRDDLLFYAPFEYSFIASFARGSPAPTGEKGTFVEGIKGKGVIFGQAIDYQMPANINPQEGTFSIWIKPVDWQSGDGKNHYFTYFFFSNLDVLLYQFYPGNAGVVFTQQNKAVLDCRQWFGFKKNNFYHLLFTYKPGELAFYIDGILMKKVDEGVIPFGGEGSFRFLAEEQTVFDEMLIFNRALTLAEIKALYHGTRY